MKKIVLWLCIFPLFASAQTDGIKWTKGLTWAQILEKAKIENKYIFLDCYATWCRPCHAMDKNVFSDRQLGNIANEQFISVKLQMDSTAYDNDTVKGVYRDAQYIGSQYRVTAFPTFLFFNPDGIPLHKATGYKSPKDFIALITQALDTTRQYYALLRNFKPGKLDTAFLKALAKNLKGSDEGFASQMAVDYLKRIPRSMLDNEDNVNFMCEFRGDSEMQIFVSDYLKTIPVSKLSTDNNLTLLANFDSIASVRDRVHSYLSDLHNIGVGHNIYLLRVFKNHAPFQRIADQYIKQLPTSKIFNIETLRFIDDFTYSSNNKGFNIFYKFPHKIDSVFEFKGYAFEKIVGVVMKEYYEDYYQRAVENNIDNIPWRQIQTTITKKFGYAIAERIDIQIKANLYEYLAKHTNAYWDKYIKYYIRNVEKYGTDTTGPRHQLTDAIALNNFVFNAIFYHSTDPNAIRTGLKWMEGVIRRNPKEANNIDTYANLLFKAGRKADAIRWQEKAIQIAVEQHQDIYLPSLRDNLAKMNNGDPTWIKDVK